MFYEWLQVIVDKLLVRFSVYLFSELLVPGKGLAQPLFQGYGFWHQIMLSLYIQKIFIVIEAEIFPRFYGKFHRNKFWIMAGDLVTKSSPLFNRNTMGISNIKNFLRWLLNKQDFHKSAQIIYMEELQFEITMPGKKKLPICYCTVKDEGLSVYVVHGTVQIRRAKNVGVRNTRKQGLFSSDFIGSIFSQKTLGPQMAFSWKGCKVLSGYTALELISM